MRAVLSAPRLMAAGWLMRSRVALASQSRQHDSMRKTESESTFESLTEQDRDEDKDQDQDTGDETSQQQAQRAYLLNVSSAERQASSAFSKVGVPLGQVLGRWITDYEGNAMGTFKMRLAEPVELASGHRFETQITGRLEAGRLVNLRGISDQDGVAVTEIISAGRDLLKFKSDKAVTIAAAPAPGSKL